MGPDGWQGNDGQGNPAIFRYRMDSIGGTPTAAAETTAPREKLPLPAIPPPTANRGRSGNRGCNSHALRHILDQWP